MFRFSWNLGTPFSWNQQGLSRPVYVLPFLAKCERAIFHILSVPCQPVDSSLHFRRNVEWTLRYWYWYILLIAVGFIPGGICKYIFTHKQHTKHNQTDYNTYVTIKIHKHTIRIHERNNKDMSVTELNMNTTITKQNKTKQNKTMNPFTVPQNLSLFHFPSLCYSYLGIANFSVFGATVGFCP